MRKTLLVLNRMKDEGVIEDYAIGGAMGASFYIEALQTFDLDIFFKPVDDSEFMVLEDIYKWADKFNYELDREHIIIEGFPVQFLPVHEITKDALKEATEELFFGVSVKVFSPEYLMVIMLQLNRAKDKMRLIKFVEESSFNETKLERLLKKYDLEHKFIDFLNKFFG